MAKASSVFICQNCGFESPKWMGQCPSCSAWNTFEESVSQVQGVRKGQGNIHTPARVLKFSDVKDYDKELQRLPTGMEEFDRVLGGGIVFGSVVLIGGEPGIGKSTLLTHLTINILMQGESVKRKEEGRNRVLYVAGEESPEQISLRIQRMQTIDHPPSHKATEGQSRRQANENTTPLVSPLTKGGSKPSAHNLMDSSLGDFAVEDKKNPKSNDQDGMLRGKGGWKENLLFLTSTDVDDITASITQEKPELVIVDSIQTLSTQDLSGATGSVGQLKECTDRLTRTAKALSIPIFLVGHVTKEGSIAGPKVLEHMVDSVLELSGERTGQYRILRAVKNRFGATDEVGIFVHTDVGLEEVTNPSGTFLEERVVGSPGSALVSIVEGTRPILIEVQALVVRSELPVPRRIARGIPVPKLQVIVAVLEKFCHLPLGTCDVFVNIAGGMTVTEPAVDLGIAVALASSYHGVPSPKDTVYVGEVGLLGEVRKVNLLEKRVKESKRLGFTSVVAAGKGRVERVQDVVRVVSKASSQ